MISNSNYISTKPLVSIITVCFNAGETLERAISSVLSQSYNNIEYIIVDGGSSDNSVNIINRYKDQLSYWVSEEDSGIAEAFNKGIRMASGKLIGILNSDDWYDPDAIKIVVDFYRRTRADFFIGCLRFCQNKNKSFQICPDPNYRRKINYRMPAINHPASFFTKTLYQELGLYDVSLQYAMDYDFFLRSIQHKKVSCLIQDKVLTNMGAGGKSDVDAIKAYREVLEIAPCKTRARLWFLFSVFKVYIRKIFNFFPFGNNIIHFLRNLKY
jgi:glycosyltransferase involved in cell wall biosynthesis